MYSLTMDALAKVGVLRDFSRDSYHQKGFVSKRRWEVRFSGVPKRVVSVPDRYPAPYQELRQDKTP